MHTYSTEFFKKQTGASILASFTEPEKSVEILYERNR